MGLFPRMLVMLSLWRHPVHLGDPFILCFDFFALFIRPYTDEEYVTYFCYGSMCCVDATVGAYSDTDVTEVHVTVSEVVCVRLFISFTHYICHVSCLGMHVTV